MLFHSLGFIFIFLPSVLFLYYIIGKYTKVSTKFVLIFSGIIFYSYWNIILTPVILISIFTNYYFSKKIIYNSILSNKKKILVSSIIFNILYLLFLKYTDFLIINFNAVFDSNISKLNFPFPLALSFVTFQSINFLVNCYDGVINKISLKNFFLFIIFFPQLIAGPIVQYNYMMPQFSNSKTISVMKKYILIGLVVFAIGMFKKVFIADNLSIIVESIFSGDEPLNFIHTWVGTFSFTMQIYFDFSGYIDMATGAALLFGINLPVNFDSPYKSKSINEFWQKWHITLSNFLMNFIYFPLSRSIKVITFNKSMIFILITFILAGLWHGPSWNYVIFGGIHGLGIIFHHFFKKKYNFKIYKFVSIFFTFNYINLSFIFFRSKDISTALSIIKEMFNFSSFNNLVIMSQIYSLQFYVLILSFIIVFFFRNTNFLISQFKTND